MSPGGIDRLAQASLPTLRSLLTDQGDIPYASSANTPARLALPTKGYMYVADASAPRGEPIARKNRLTNGSFPVQQRITVGTTDNSYGIDRWRLLLEAASAAAISQEPSDFPTDGAKSAAKLIVGAAPNNKFGVFQVLEFADCADLRGKTVSLQVKIKATAGITDVRMAVLEWTGTANAVSADPISAWNAALTNPTLIASWAYLNTPVSLAPTTSWATYKIEGIPVGASMNNLAVLIWSDDKTTTTTTDILRITDVQLEEGSICTQVERRPVEQELWDCYWWLYQWGVTGLAEPIGIALNATVLTTHGTTAPPRPMRVQPTFSSMTFSAVPGTAGTPTTGTISRRTFEIYNVSANWTTTAVISLVATASAEL